MFRSLPLVQAHLLMTASIPNPDEASSHRESYQRTTDHSWPWTGYRSASRPRSGRATLATVSRIGQSHPCRWRSRTHLLAIRQCTAQQLHLGAHESYGRSADCCSSRARTVPHNEFPQKDDTQGLGVHASHALSERGVWQALGWGADLVPYPAPSAQVFVQINHYSSL